MKPVLKVALCMVLLSLLAGAGCYAALAENTLYLPASTKVIEEEAFYGAIE
mgnify:CR=1 FL=1